MNFNLGTSSNSGQALRRPSELARVTGLGGCFGLCGSGSGGDGRIPKFYPDRTSRTDRVHSVQGKWRRYEGIWGSGLHFVQTGFTRLAENGVVLHRFEAFTRKNNLAQTLCFQVLCHSKREIVALIGRGVHRFLYGFVLFIWRPVGG
jgi:hypothetical protein